MAEYTTNECTDMVIVCGIAGENACAAARLYAERFPERVRHPDNNVILRCIRRVRETGTLLLDRRNHGVLVHRVDAEERILRAFEENPRNSVRRVAQILSRDTWCIVLYVRMDCIRIISSGCSNFSGTWWSNSLASAITRP
ncbi:hypothetical protein ACFW04_001325 [Cataglyphis niger]